MSIETEMNSSIAKARSMDINKLNAWIKSKKFFYMTSFLLPIVPMASCYLAIQSDNGLWLWSMIIFFYFGITALDKIFGDDDANPNEDMIEDLKSQRYYVNILLLSVPLLWAAVITMAYTVASYEWSLIGFLGGALSAGLLAGVGINLGHELGHKVNDKQQQLAAKLTTAISGYGHFMIEHNKGHHKDVSTPEDPASSRMGESIYKFAKREIPGAFRRAWDLEAKRLHRLGKSEWSLSNEIVQTWMITAALYSSLLALFGPIMIPFLAIVAFYGYWTLTSANYIEHYGLLRQKTKDGRFERCQPRHSWNANQKVSNLVLLHLQRHSDHHAHPTRAYQVLRDYENVPMLPAGYPWMFAMALFPSVWRSVMDPKVVDWAGNDMNLVNIDPDSREDLFEKYHQPMPEATAA